MILNRILLFRQFFGANSFCKSVKIKGFSALQKNESKKIQEIKDFVLNQNKLDSKSSDLKKPVLLYSNENSAFYRRLFVLNVCQFFFWIYLANVGIAFAIKKQKSKPKSKNTDKLESEVGSFTKLVQDTKILWKEHSTQMLLSIGL